MTTLKVQGKPGQAAQAALAPHIGTLYANPGKRIVGVVELAHIERTQPAPESDKDASVTMRITSLEIPNADQEDTIRQAQRALHMQRTAFGTLNEAGEMELAERTLQLTGGMLNAIETARLRASLSHWMNYARRCVDNEKLTLSEVRNELRTVADGMSSALNAAHPDDEDA